MQKFKNGILLAFFPYLKTTDSLKYRGLTIRNCEEFENVPITVQDHIRKISPMFFLRDYIRIRNTSYTYFENTEGADVDEFVKTLYEFQALISFIYSSPHPTSGDPFLRFEHSSFYIFQPDQISKYLLLNDHGTEILPGLLELEFDSRNEIAGYEVRLNNEAFFWVTSGSKIFPPTASIWLNISQNLSADFNYRTSGSTSTVIEFFVKRKQRDQFYKRILTALAWYNRSNRINLDESVALVNLAIAFESLLDLDQGKGITDRFKSAVNLLVGNIPRLESWLIQFYNARSRIVHRGWSENLMFIATDDPNKAKAPELKYRSLVTYGRQIFGICIVTLLTGAQLAENLRLESLLSTNQQRFERICKKLSKSKETPEERILSIQQDVNDIDTYRFTSEAGLKVEQLIGTAKLLMNTFVETKPENVVEIINLAEKFSKVSTSDTYEALSLIKEIHESFGKTEGQPLVSISRNVASFIDSVWHYTFMLFFHLDKMKKEEDK